MQSHNEGSTPVSDPTRLHRRQVVLHRHLDVASFESQKIGVEFVGIFFTSETDDDLTLADRSPSLHELVIDAETWKDFGSPEMLTMTIVPGDALNEEEA